MAGSAKPLRLAGDQIAEPAEQGPALAGIQPGPRAVGERPVRRPDGAIDVRGVAPRDERPGLAEVGVEGLEVHPRGRLDELTVDVVPILLHGRLPFMVLTQRDCGFAGTSRWR